MPSNSHNEDPSVERHEGKHHHVGKPHPDPMNNGLGSATQKAVCRGFDELGMREHFNKHRDDEDEDQGQDVHAGASAGPAGEEDLGVLPPEEGGVHHHAVQLVVVDVHGRRRWWSWRCCDFTTHAWHFITAVHGTSSEHSLLFLSLFLSPLLCFLFLSLHCFYGSDPTLK